MKKVILIAAVLTMLFFATGLVSGEEMVKIFINGNEVHPDTPPLIVNDRTMVPLRFVSEQLGAKVFWDEAKREVLVQSGEKSNIKYLKVNGQQTAWRYWEINGDLYTDMHTAIALLKEKNRMSYISYNYSEDILLINSGVMTVNTTTIEDFKAVSLEKLNVRTGMFNYQWDSDTGDLKI